MKKLLQNFLKEIFPSEILFEKMSRRGSDAQNYSLADLPSLFENPLAGISPATLRQNFDAALELETLKTKLQSKSDWNIKCEAILRVMSLIKGGIFNFSGFDFSEIAQDIAACVTDLRSTLVRWGSMCATAAAQTLGSQFSNYVDIFIPAFFKQTTHGTAIISQSCRLAILQIAASTPHRRTVRCILNEVSSKSTVHRKIVAESILKIQQFWPPSSYQSSLNHIKNVINDLKTDKSSEVRQISRELDSFQPGPRTPSPRKQSQQIAFTREKEQQQSKSPLSYSSNTLKGSKKVGSVSPYASSSPNSSNSTIMNSQPNSPRISINSPCSSNSSYASPNSPHSSSTTIFNSNYTLSMPSNSSEASFIAQQVSNMLQNPNKFDPQKHQISEIIPHAVSLSPDNSIWQTVIVSLLEECPKDLKKGMTSILNSTKFNEIILRKALAVYGFDDLINDFKKGVDKISFGAAVLTKVPEYELSENSIFLLRQFAKKKSKIPDSKTVIESLDGKSLSIQKAMQMIVNCLINGKPYHDLLRIIFESEDHSPLQGSLGMISDLLEHKDVKVVERTIKFIEDLSVCNLNVPLDTLVEPIVNLLKDSQSIIPPIAERCLLRMMNTINFKSTIFPLIDESPGEIGIIMEEFFSSLSKNELTKYKEIVPDAILPLFESKHLTARRTAVMLYVRFLIAFGESFREQISKISEINQTLVQRFYDQQHKT
ncbi:hypothetical protein TRFO_33281 [Tritrichomonas foetus]|uniref:CLASP N-terminal domain-containing protein n=1 Tax=Tritrichomonas foetus TaxID=1144522 RepID=A0A1J4JRJ9_9EUKA|nr:hypothetical protein TRFO_33281 [Tritrichomonas foetus]|eukprot:OHT00148.1 hypothetical protein TRFO_33281 [Tritrichomonas foetus]